MRRRAFLLVPTLFLAACATKMGSGGKTETVVNPRYLAKSDVDRIIDTVRSEVLASLRRFAEKLYRRNPKEWKKSNQASVEAAVTRLFSTRRVDFPELEGKREGAAAMLAFREDYAGDRVLALMAGLVSMVYAAFEDKDDFYMLDDLNEQKLYNCARNLEIAMWKLASARTASGELVLLSNELDPNNRNLSFEREFGRVVGLLDLLAKVVADKHGRAISRFTQNIATAVFLPISAVTAFIR